MNDELFNRRVLREVSKSNGISCEDIAKNIQREEFNVRYALHRLMEVGDVLETGGLYVRAHGGYVTDGPKGAA